MSSPDIPPFDLVPMLKVIEDLENLTLANLKLGTIFTCLVMIFDRHEEKLDHCDLKQGHHRSHNAPVRMH